MRYPYFLCMVLATLASRREHLTVAVGDFLLDEKSFSLTSVISIQSETGFATRQAHLIERYSREQQRAFLQYNIPSSSMNADFYHDANTDISIFLSRKYRSCAATTLVYLYQNLLLDSQAILSLLNQLDADIGRQLRKNLVGPAKLLFYVASRANQLRRNTPRESDRSLVEYTLDIDLRSSKYTDTAKISLLFSGTGDQLSGATVLREALPKQMTVKFIKSSVKLSIAYLHHELLETGGQVVAKDLTQINSDVVIDEFAFPPSFDCAQYMERAGRLDMFEGFDLHAPVRLSFNARTKPIIGRPQQHFVAFDGTTQSVRIDYTHGSISTSPARLKQVLDLRTNRKYVIVDTLNTGGQDLSSTSHCAATHLFSLDRSEHKVPSLSNFLLGAEKFNYMGRAQVRGIKARVYEAISNQLPYWFNQPLLYTDRKGEQHFRVTGEPVRERAFGSGSGTPTMNRYNVVIYVAETSEGAKGLRLLMLEVYDRNLVKTSAFRRVMAAHLYDFIWELSESEDGDSVEDLFRLQDVCSAGGGNDRYAELELLLEHEPVNGANLTWLESSSRRRTALNAALRDTLNLQTTMVYDMKTLYTAGALRASFKVAEHPQTLYRLTFVGNARLARQSTTVQAIKSESLAECLRLVKEYSQQPMHLYFSESSGICILERENQTNSVLELASQESGELFKVETTKDREMDFRSLWLSDTKTDKLQQRPMTLRYLQQDNFIQPVAPEEISMRIRSIKLKNFNFMNTGSIEEVQVTTLSGFAFVSESTDVQQVTTTTSKELCKAACLAANTCRSFSYCATTGVTCLLSTETLTAPIVREQLINPESQRLRTGSRLVVRTGLGSEIVELRRDVRCDLYNKIHMDLFRSGLPARVSLNKLEISRVPSAEQCAELCFNRSLQTIQYTAEIDEQMDLLLSLADEPSQQREALQKVHRDYRQTMTAFCSYFLYLEGWLTDEQRKLIEHRAASKSDNQEQSLAEGGGYCALESGASKSDGSRANNEVMFLFDSYRFDFTTLYEKKHGFILQRTPLDHVELAAYHSLTQFNSTNDREFSILKEAVEDGKNFQLELMADPMSCAQQCFAQSSGLWPTCGSFDTITVQHDWGSSTRCHLNSLVSSERILEPDSFSQNTQLWHYEPRFGYLRQMANRLSELETSTNEHQVQSGESTSTSALLLLSLIFLSISSGVGLSFLFARHFRPTDSSSASFQLNQVLAEE